MDRAGAGAAASLKVLTVIVSMKTNMGTCLSCGHLPIFNSRNNFFLYPIKMSSLYLRPLL